MNKPRWIILIRPALLVYVCINIIGMALDIYFVLKVERLILLEDRSPDFGDSWDMFTTTVPIELICSIYTFIWCVIAVKDIVRRHNYHAAMVSVAVIMTWVATLLFEKHYHPSL